jgi:Tol biopolymer transport system component
MLYPCYTPGLGLSPNGLWAAFFSFSDSGGLKIVSVDGTKQWDVYYSELSGMTCPCGDALVAIDHWSADGKYIYLYPYMMGDGGYDWVWNKQTQLIRLDLSSGSWIDTHMGNSYSFSPDDQFIAYRSESGVHIHDLSTREEMVFPVSTGFIDFGRFVWSPDGSRLIFAAAKEDLNLEEQESGLTVFLISLSDSSVITLFEADLRYLYPIAWPEQNRVIFKTLYERQTYQFDLLTSELISIDWP